MFIFNLSTISESERMLGAEIHIYQKKMKSRADGVVISLHQVAPSYLTMIDTRPLNVAGVGWLNYDVTNAVTTCVTGDHKSHHLLAVNFERQSGKRIPLKRFMRHMHKPFVVVFTDAAQNLSVDHLDPYFGRAKYSGSLIDPETGLELGSSHNWEYTKTQEKETGEYDDELDEDKEIESEIFRDFEWAPLGGVDDYDGDDDVMFENRIPAMPVEDPPRSRRSVLDNEIPLDKIAAPPAETDSNVAPTNPRERPNLTESDDSTEDPDTILISKAKQRKQRRQRRNRKRGRSEKRTLPMPEEWGEEAVSTRSGSEVKRCGLRSLYVDFTDLGWNRWIIAPEGFLMNYCAGQCNFPQLEGLQPSNHAIVQSLVHTIGIKQEVPAPCCVPEVMTSLLLLYAEDNNLILKNYPSMSVKSCACR